MDSTIAGNLIFLFLLPNCGFYLKLQSFWKTLPSCNESDTICQEGLRVRQQEGSVVSGGGGRQFAVSAPCNIHHPVWCNPFDALWNALQQEWAPVWLTSLFSSTSIGTCMFDNHIFIKLRKIFSMQRHQNMTIPAMCLCKKRRKSRVRRNLVLTQLCPPASNHLRLSLSASLVMLMVALTYWPLRRGTEQTSFWFLSKAARTSCT